MARFVVWAEFEPTRQPSRRRRAAPRKEAPRAHPFAASAEQIRAALNELGTANESQAAAFERITALLPTADAAPVASPDLPSVTESATIVDNELLPWRVEALALDPVHALRVLMSLGGGATVPSVAVGPDLQFWATAARFACELLSGQRFLPAIEIEDKGECFTARWRPPLDQEGDRQRLAALAQSMPAVCRSLAWDTATPPPAARALLTDFLQATTDAVARQALAGGSVPAKSRAKSQRRHRRAPAPAAAYVDALRDDPVLAGEPTALARLRDQHRAWIEAGRAAEVTETFRICFRLDPPAESIDVETGARRRAGNDWTLQYLLQATDDPSLLVPAAEVWRRRGSTAQFLDRRFDNPQERLLAGLGHASRLVPPIEDSLHTARPEACSLTVAEAYDFVRERALLLRSSGFGVLVPGLQAKLGIHLRLGRSARSGQSSAQRAFTWDSLVQYDWQLAIGDQALSREEFESLARIKEPLVQIRGQWVELRPEQIAQALAFFDKQPAEDGMSLSDAMKLALAPNGDLGLPVANVETEGWIDTLMRDLRDGERQEVGTEPPGFEGRLRPYQKDGVSWLASLSRFGVGACLADDMGLGKTVQLIALLLLQRARDAGEAGPTLLICPTSVVGNWRHELARFAPSLRALVHHGAGRDKQAFAEEAQRSDLVISTYALLHRDQPELAAVDWSNVVLDEAQNIKNASTRAAQAARSLRARWRVALTGTPIENRLSDLWSLFQFLDPGYLGSNEQFRRRFISPIERAGDATATARLKALIGPLILRRVKTDRSIIEDLPEKNEMKVFCTLTKEQATLYEAIVRDSVRQIEESEGMQRRGLILATLAKLKQVCDHPALFLKDGSALGDRSGKLARLGEMLEEALALGDRALIFSQYAQMGALLKSHLEAAAGQEVLFLHGGTPVAQRDRMVARFQGEGRGPQIFILSIKAGGTGLNLTRANHVFHFDRWWNPAVENQATDRAFRIGQRRDVQVHKFICAGTFEETIDELIERKVALSQSIIGTSEAWITEMSTDDLRDLFALRRDAVGVE